MEHKERTRTSISPKGLNRSTPAHIVEDGSLEVCHNLRFANGAWRNVQNFTSQSIPDKLKGEEILYLHPVGGEHNFITKQDHTVTGEKVRLYAMLAQLQAQSELEEAAAESASLDLDFDFDSPTIGVLRNYGTRYYLDAPLSRLNLRRDVNLYDKDENKIGQVVAYGNHELFYRPLSGEHSFTLYAMEALLSKLGESKQKTLYFTTSTPNAEYPNNYVFVKKGSNQFSYYGSIYSATDSFLTIYEAETGTLVSCKLNSLKEERNHFENCATLENTTIYYNSLTNGAIALYVSGSTTAFSYLHDIEKVENSLTPKFTLGVNFQKIYLQYDLDGNEVSFFRNTGESDEAYLARYFTEVPEDLQYLGSQMKLCVLASCITAYTWDFGAVTGGVESIPNFYADYGANITEDVVDTTHHSLNAWDGDGNLLSNFGTFGEELTITHFGNMLIVRDVSRAKTHYFLYSEQAYQPYGSIGDTSLSFSVSANKTIESPQMKDIPMFYKAPGYSSKVDGSLEGRLLVGAGEAILRLGSEDKYDTLDSSGNILLIDSHQGYFRGELALFVVARAEDGTEIYRTAPQVFRSETLLDTDCEVCLFNPSSKEYAEEYPEAFDTDYYPHTYLIWKSMNWRDGVGITKNAPTAYKKWQNVADKKKNKETISKFLSSVTASKLYKLDVEISAEGENIHELAIYSTRLCPLFVLEGDSIKVNPVDILDEPFYEMKVLARDEKEYTITYNDLKDIEAKQDSVYEPTQSGENTFYASEGIEYNNSFHAYGIEVLQPMFSSSSLIGADSGSISHIATSRLYDNSTVYAMYSVADILDDTRDYESLADKQGYFISFREQLQEVLFGKKIGGSDNMEVLAKFDPTYSTSLSISYIENRNEDAYDSDEVSIVQPNIFETTNWDNATFGQKIADNSGSFAKYVPISLNNMDVAETESCTPTYPIPVSNRIQVSESGNPLVNPYDTSYRVGTSNNRIIAMNSVALKLSDAKFGEFPLYVFTTEGIFAMQTGVESTYSNIIPIAKDVIINPCTLAVNDAVLFFTENGLHSLSARGIELLSAGLHDSDNRIPEWMRTCRLVHLPEYDEVMCVLMDGENTTGKAYICSPKNSCWSERDVPIGRIFGEGDIVGAEDISHIYSEGDSIAADIELRTRPIKLGGAKELKRLETLVVRFESEEDVNISVEILGSVDSESWMTLRSLNVTTNKDILIRRTPASVKYLSFVVKIDPLTSPIRIIQFDTEHYLRFLRKMR